MASASALRVLSVASRGTLSVPSKISSKSLETSTLQHAQLRSQLVGVFGEAVQPGPLVAPAFVVTNAPEKPLVRGVLHVLRNLDQNMHRIDGDQAYA